LTVGVSIDVEINKGKIAVATSSINKNFSSAGLRAGRALEQSIGNSFSRISKLAIGAGAAIAAAFGAKKVLAAARDQEDSVNALNSALQNTGKFSEESSKGLQQLASELQKVTKFGDETILKSQALIQNLADLSDRNLKRATVATTDLATALRIDLQSASTLVGKALSGQTSALSRFGIQIEKGANEAETLDNVLKALSERFGGSAIRDANTFSGGIARISNSFDGLLKTIGETIIKSKGIGQVTNAIANAFDAVNESLRKSLANFSLIQDVLIPLSKVADGVVTFLILPLEQFFNFARVLQNTLNFVAATIVETYAKIGKAVSSALSSIGLETKENAQFFADFAETTALVAEETAERLAKSFESAFDFPVSETLERKNQEILAGLEKINASVEEKTKNTSKKVKAGFEEDAQAIAETSRQISAVINQNLVRGISGGIQNIVESVSKGQNAFSNFGKFVLNTAGDLAIQMGQVLIGTGIGITALTKLQGAQAIAAGAGLVALGAVIKSLSGGASSSSPTSTGGNNFATTEPAITTTDPQNLERATPQTTLNLTVQGNVVDQDSFLTDLADGLGDIITGRGLAIRGVNA
jgi:hypothetical protein